MPLCCCDSLQSRPTNHVLLQALQAYCMCEASAHSRTCTALLCDCADATVPAVPYTPQVLLQALRCATAVAHTHLRVQQQPCVVLTPVLACVFCRCWPPLAVWRGRRCWSLVLVSGASPGSWQGMVGERFSSSEGFVVELLALGFVVEGAALQIL